MQFVILAGGRGTRMQARIGGLPKGMADLCGSPLIERQILLARSFGIRDVLLLTGYGADAIESYFGCGERWDMRIRYSRETQPLGTAGALLQAFDLLDEAFVAHTETLS